MFKSTLGYILICAAWLGLANASCTHGTERVILTADLNDACVLDEDCFEGLKYETDQAIQDQKWRAETGMNKKEERKNNNNNNTRQLRGRRRLGKCAKGNELLCLFLAGKARRLDDEADYEDMVDAINDPCWGDEKNLDNNAFKAHMNAVLAGKPTSEVHYRVQQCIC